MRPQFKIKATHKKYAIQIYGALEIKSFEICCHRTFPAHEEIGKSNIQCEALGNFSLPLLRCRRRRRSSEMSITKENICCSNLFF